MDLKENLKDKKQEKINTLLQVGSKDVTHSALDYYNKTNIYIIKI